MGKRVITIHGIDTVGKWQDEVKQVLAPHFDCLNVKYSLFRRFGAVKLIFESFWFLYIAIEALFLLGLGIFSTSRFPLLLGLGFLVISLSTGFALAHRTRSIVINQLKAFIDSRAFSGEPAHLIAHSFGTFLAGNLIKKFLSIRFDRVIFAGCVLPRRFAWERVFQQHFRAFRHLRNEIAAKDWVPRLADLGKFLLLRGFGSAGALGFLGHTALIHNVEAPTRRCTDCACEERAVAKIHNVIHREYAHSDQFLGAGHARSFWLPYLWSLEPNEFREFVEMCSLAVSLDLRKTRVVSRLWKEN